MNKIKYILLIVLAGMLFSCNLDRFPADSIEQSQSLRSVSDADKLVRGAYSLWRAYTYGDYLMPQDVQTDLLHATIDYGNRNGAYYSWSSLTSGQTSAPWAQMYRLLSNLNNIINNIDNVTFSDSEKDQLENLKAEAYLMRAYAYHILVQRYAKDYEPETAATDLGVPLVLEYDVTLKPARATVAEVYNQIVSDINTAKGLIKASLGNAIPTRITNDVVTALEARVYLSMHKWSEAATAANSLINKGAYPLETTLDGLTSMWKDDNSKEIIMHLFLSGTESVNQNSTYLGYITSTGKYAPDFIPEKWVYDLYDDSDIRKSAYFITGTLYLGGTDYTGVYILNKYPFTTNFSTSGDYKHSPIVFRIAEMYLISAEAAAQSVSTEAAALATLNVLRQTRGLSAISSLSGQALMTEIRNERTRELFCEGFRLDDLKRWKLDMKRSDPQNSVIAAPGPVRLEVAAGNDKFVWGIPREDIMTNPNLRGQQNQGW